jgi:hypothetical protein
MCCATPPPARAEALQAVERLMRLRRRGRGQRRGVTRPTAPPEPRGCFCHDALKRPLSRFHAPLAQTRSYTDSHPPWHFIEARVSRYLAVAFNEPRDACAPSNDRVQGTRFRSFWPHVARSPKNSSGRTSVSPAFSCSREESSFEFRVLLRLDHNFFQYSAWRLVFCHTLYAPHVARSPKNSFARSNVSITFSCSRNETLFESRGLLRLDRAVLRFA